jgi:hypothetical protein
LLSQNFSCILKLDKLLPMLEVIIDSSLRSESLHVLSDQAYLAHRLASRTFCFSFCVHHFFKILFIKFKFFYSLQKFAWLAVWIVSCLQLFFFNTELLSKIKCFFVRIAYVLKYGVPLASYFFYSIPTFFFKTLPCHFGHYRKIAAKPNFWMLVTFLYILINPIVLGMELNLLPLVFCDCSFAGNALFNIFFLMIRKRKQRFLSFP